MRNVHKIEKGGNGIASTALRNREYMSSIIRARRQTSSRKTWVFDYDGVIVPDFTAKDIKRGYERAYDFISEARGVDRKKAKRMVDEIEREQKEYKEPLVSSVHRIVPEVPIPQLFRHFFVGYKKDHGHFGRDPWLVSHLNILHRKGIEKTILTNTPVAVVSRSMERKGISGYFKAVMVCDSFGGVMKPKPEAFMLALLNLGISAKETVFIDNSIQNILVAREMGIFSVHIHGDESSGVDGADISYSSLREFLDEHA